MGDVKAASETVDATVEREAHAKAKPWKVTVREGRDLRELTISPSSLHPGVWSYDANGSAYGPTAAQAIERFARMANWKVLEIVPPEGETYDAARVPTPAVSELLTGVTGGDWQWHSFGSDDPGVHAFDRKDMSYQRLATCKHRKNATLMAAAKDLALDLIESRAEVTRLRAIVDSDDRVAVAKRQERERLSAMVAEWLPQFGKGWTVRSALDLVAKAIARDPAESEAAQ